MNKIFIMVDLETLSNKSNAAIISIGACTFGRSITHPHLEADLDRRDYFYDKIDPASYDKFIEVGVFHKSHQTMEWWANQDDAVRAEAFSGTEPIEVVLESFVNWVNRISQESNATPYIFSHGAVFDIPVLNHAMDVFYITCPWNYRNEMCYRTICSMFPQATESAKKIIQNPIAHNALQDAIYQAAILTDIMHYLLLDGVSIWVK